jgi:hypothetical protein
MVESPTKVNGTPDVWGPYANYDDIAKLEYGRLLWKSPAGRRALLAHWTNPDHPHRERFSQYRHLIEEALDAQSSDAVLDASLRRRFSSLRAIAREIPSVFGSFFSPNP